MVIEKKDWTEEIWEEYYMEKELEARIDEEAAKYSEDEEDNE